MAEQRRPYHNYSSGRLADELGEVRALISQLEAKETELKQELIHRGSGSHSGASFKATVSLNCDRKGIDTKALREEYPAIAAELEVVTKYDLVRTTPHPSTLAKGKTSDE